jgi:hypothetical protein
MSFSWSRLCCIRLFSGRCKQQGVGVTATVAAQNKLDTLHPLGMETPSLHPQPKQQTCR